jgi:hypothetical protein
MKNMDQGQTLSRLPLEMLRLSASAFRPAACHNLDKKVALLAGLYDPINLKDMGSVSLQNRIDTKFVLTNRELLTALAALTADYRILEIDGVRLNKYQTLYFDTPGFHLFHDHVNNRPERFKVRCREYADTHLSFLEVKHHTRKDRTIKERMRTSRPVLSINEDMDNWLRGVAPLKGAELEPKLWNSFTRMTLVGKNNPERVTFDFDLSFSSQTSPLNLSGLVIAEVKRDSTGAPSPMMDQMRAQRIRARGFSKYAVGVGLLYDRVKKNALKPKLLFVEKFVKGQA